MLAFEGFARWLGRAIQATADRLLPLFRREPRRDLEDATVGFRDQLVRTLASHQEYYERWAKTWEFQALLKARPVAGDTSLGDEYVAAIRPLVWRASERDGFVTDVQAMRRRVEDHVPRKEAERNLKLGPGGLRDIEFADLAYAPPFSPVWDPTQIAARLARAAARK